MKLTEKRVYDLLAAFRSADPTPGGGSASALTGAVGASLLAMVAGLAKPRVATEPDTTELRNAGLRCTELATQLEHLVNRDSDAYNMVMEAYRLPKLADDEKARRAAAIQNGIKEATEAPLEVMRRCREALGIVPVVERLGNPNATSDVKVAVYLLRAALAGAAENVQINLGSLKDAGYVQQVRGEAAALEGGTRD
jgi:methenyltetrahydrofolate cyclohydrolase